MSEAKGRGVAMAKAVWVFGLVLAVTGVVVACGLRCGGRGLDRGCAEFTAAPRYPGTPPVTYMSLGRV